MGYPFELCICRHPGGSCADLPSKFRVNSISFKASVHNFVSDVVYSF